MMPTEPNDSELDPLLADAVAELRTAVPARASARAALSTALAAEALPTVAMPRLTVASPAPDALPAKRLRWLTTGRSVRVSPLGLLAAASLLIAGTAAVTSRLGTGATPPVVAGAPTAATPAAAQVVRFSLAAPQARRVSLVGDFNGWDPSATALQQQDGTWTVVIPVPPGRHQYGFVVDGSTWIADPDAARSADTDFGTPNSVVYVGS
jgi:Glycogen recognition site of AMP-activated protein kinase